MSAVSKGVVGRSFPKKDAYQKVSGTARYAGDLLMAGMLHAAILRSPHAAARIKAVNTEQAEAMPGVLTILHGGNFTARPYTNSEWDAPAALGSLPRDQVLFSDTVRYVGEPVAAIAAVDRETALAAARAITVDYEPVQGVFDPEAAMSPDAPIVQEGMDSNIAAHLEFPFGDREAGFTEADQVIERRFVTSRQKQTPMEPFTCVAHYEDETLTVWTPSQTPHQLRVKLADVFNLPVHRVRIITPTVGGGFGARTGLVGEPWAAALAIKTGRPVRLEYSRYEDFIATEARHPAILDVKAGFKNDGTLTGFYMKAVLNTGPYRSQGPNVTAVLGLTALRPYKFRHRVFDGYTVLTNSPLASAYRGFGGPQAIFALEQTIDEIAYRLGKDPVEFRLATLSGKGDQDGLLQRPIVGDGLRRCIELGAEKFQWYEKRQQRREQAGPWRRGTGMAVAVWVSGTGCLGPNLTEASVANARLNADGTLTLTTGVADCGTGIGTSLAQIAAEELGMPFESIQVIMGDTDVTPLDLGAHASRSLFVGGLAVRAAAANVREKMAQVASELLEARPEDLEFADGKCHVRGAPHQHVTYQQIASKAFYTDHSEIHGHGTAPQNQAPPYGAQFADVEVNVKTGQIRVTHLLAVHDVGRAINPKLVEGQIEGGVVQGIAYALAEDMPVDPETGEPYATSFMDYRVPTIQDVPLVESVIVEEPDDSGPFGAKSIGEIPIIPTAPAIANAVYDAIGVRITELPMTAPKVLAAIKGAKAG